MSTHRERREAKADRLDEWADKRAAKASAESTAASAKADLIPFGQPILVGHHSEGRDRRFRNGIVAGFDRALEHGAKAADMASRAETIRAQNDNAIYDDDPDAIERLTEKIARLEQQRDTRKAANAAFRKDNREQLRAMTAYDRGQAVPFPSYSLSNLSGNISRLRQRLERLKAHDPRHEKDRIITARFAGECADCQAPIEADQIIRYSRAAGSRCQSCDAACE